MSPRTSEVRPALLPAELPWVYLLVPLPAALLKMPDLVDKPLPELLIKLLCMYLPWLAYGASFTILYQRVMPGALGALPRAWQRAMLHGIVVCGVTLVVSLPLVPLMEWLSGHPESLRDFMITSLIFSCASLFPALAVQRLRVRAQAAEHQTLIERRAALEAQLQALQARTDPHFLFNSLNTVASLIADDPVLAERTVERLAALFRYALESSRLRTVPLERELSMVADYLALQSARFGERLRTQLEVDEGLGDVEVPPLLLQPLVENAILHGTSQRRGGSVEIAVRREQDLLVVDVCDDGPGPGASLHGGAGTAMANVSERLRLHYAERGSLSLGAGPLGGCRARLALPIGGPQ